MANVLQYEEGAVLPVRLTIRGRQSDADPAMGNLGAGEPAGQKGLPGTGGKDGGCDALAAPGTDEKEDGHATPGTGGKEGGEETVVVSAAYTRRHMGKGEICHEFRYLDQEEEVFLSISQKNARMERGKKGGPRTAMVFDPALPATCCDYLTPFGAIPMEIRTRRIRIMDAAGRGAAIFLRARIIYRLCMGDYAVDCAVTVEAARPAGDDARGRNRI